MAGRRKTRAKSPQAVPWERQPDETDASWKAFCDYREMGPDRTIEGLRRAGRSTVVTKWSSHFDWRSRAAAYDAHLDKLRRQEVERLVKKDARELAGEHLELLEVAREACLTEVRKLLRDAKKSGAAVMNPHALARLIKETLTLQRLVIGEATERTDDGTVDLSRLSLDEVRQLKDLQTKARKT